MVRANPFTDARQQVEHQGGGVWSILWDGPLRQHFVYDGWLLSASYQATTSDGFKSVDQSYAWGPDLSDSPGGAGGIGGLAIYQDDLADSDGGTYIGPMFPAYDGNGNVVALYRLAPSSLDVQAAARYDYGPFGEALGLVGKQAHRFPFRWSTKFTDAETGLVYYGYRYYHPSLGRWISRDPIEESDDISLYAFCANSSVGLIDALGLQSEPKGRLVVAFGGFLECSHPIRFSGDFVSGRWRTDLESLHDTEVIFFCQYAIHFGSIYKSIVDRIKEPVHSSIQVSDPDTGECFPLYSTLAVVGFSWGGSAAIELAHRLAADSVRVNLVFTVDPVKKFQETFRAFRKARTTDRLVNYYQTIGNSILQGRPVTGADLEEHFPHPRQLHPAGSAATIDQLTAMIDNAASATGAGEYQLIHSDLWHMHLENGFHGSHSGLAVNLLIRSRLKEAVDRLPNSRSTWRH